MKNSVEIEHAQIGLLGEARQQIADEAKQYNNRLAETIRAAGGHWQAPNGVSWGLDENEQPIQKAAA